MSFDPAAQTEFLWRAIRARPAVAATLERLRSWPPETQARLLRDHAVEPIGRREEIDARTEADLAVGSLCELAVAQVCGYARFDAGDAIGREVLDVLDADALRRYYADYYPMLPPHLLRLHLLGKRDLPAEQMSDEQSFGVFQWYSALAARFNDDPLLDLFLKLMDDFSFGGYRIGHLVHELKDPAARRLERPALADSAWMGLFRFLNLTAELGAGLAMMDFAPRTRSMIWFTHAYWYRKVKQNLDEVSLEALRQLAPLESAIEPQAHAPEFTVADVRTSLARLTSGDWAEPLATEFAGDAVLQSVL